MSGSMRLPSMAVVAMVEPDTAENTVPATTAITASRPGTPRIMCSTPSITFEASPVWNSTSPMSTNSGIGVSEKLDTDCTPLRASWIRPGSPPMKMAAPSRLTARKANATGTPRKSSTVVPPSSSQAAASQLIMARLPERHRVAARRAFAAVEPVHAEQHFHRQEREDRGHGRDQPPLRNHDRLDDERAAGVAREGRLGAVEGDEQAHDQRQRVAQPLGVPAEARRKPAQQDVDPDVLPAAQQPRRREQRDQVEHVLRKLVGERQAAQVRQQRDVAQQHDGADH